ncbi:MAG: hypothetical protein LBP65_02070, partial [Puniceicoccales bacterium]|nr:hypothetical protein [Puniceicoccales bacterium]
MNGGQYRQEAMHLRDTMGFVQPSEARAEGGEGFPNPSGECCGLGEVGPNGKGGIGPKTPLNAS